MIIKYLLNSCKFLKFKFDRKNLNYLIFINIFFIVANFPMVSYAEKLNKPSKEYIFKYPSDQEYILGAGDVISLKVNDFTKDLNGIFVIGGDGTINVKRLRKIYVAGLTTSELEEILNKNFLKFVKQPDVQVDILTYRPLKVYIEGEVDTPGVYILENTLSQYQERYTQRNSNFFKLEENKNNVDKVNKIEDNFDGMDKKLNVFPHRNYFPTVFDAIKKSGGITINADISKIIITRKNSISDGGGRKQTTINLLDTIMLKDSNQNIRLMDDDTILIPKSNNGFLTDISKAVKSNLNPKFVKVFVYGRVISEGVVNVNQTGVVNDAIDLANGTKVLKGKIKFIRYKSDGTIEKRFFNYKKNAKRGGFNNPYLRNGDLIIVQKNVLNKTNEVISEVSEPFRGLLSTYAFFKLFEL